MVEQRYQAVLAVIEDGLSITEVAVKVGVSRQTMHTRPTRYAGGGLEALADRSHRPASCPHQMDPGVQVRVHSRSSFATLNPGRLDSRRLHRLLL